MKSILVIDDDFAIRRGIALTLQRQGFQLFEAKDRAAAQRILNDHNIDLALIDLFLEHDDGISLAQDIRQRYPGIRFIIMTAHTERDRALFAQEMYKEHFLEKSMLDQKLLKKISDVLAS